VLILTAMGTVGGGSWVGRLSNGADYYLVKPFRAVGLISLIHALLLMSGAIARPFSLTLSNLVLDNREPINLRRRVRASICLPRGESPCSSSCCAGWTRGAEKERRDISSAFRTTSHPTLSRSTFPGFEAAAGKSRQDARIHTIRGGRGI